MKKNILLTLSVFFLFSCSKATDSSNLNENKVSSSAIVSSANSHKPSECPILNGLYQESFRKIDVVTTTYWLYQTQFDSNGAIYIIKQSNSDGSVIGGVETIRADGKMHYRNFPNNSKAWIHSCVNKGLVVDFLNENKNFEIYAKQEIIPSTVINVMGYVQTSLTEDPSILEVYTGSFALIK